MVDVEHRTLCAFSQDILALSQSLVDFRLSIGEGELTHILYAFHPFLLFFGYVIIGIVQVGQNLFVACFQHLVFLLEVLQDVSHAQTSTAGFLAISGADTLTCSPHLVLSLGCFVCPVQNAMSGQDEVGALADVQTLLQIVTCGFQLLGFSHEKVWSYHTSVANDVEFAFIKYSRGNATQYELLALKDDGMPSVGAACKSGHNIVFGSEHVHYFSFSFISENNAQQGIHFSFCHDKIIYV